MWEVGGLCCDKGPSTIRCYPPRQMLRARHGRINGHLFKAVWPWYVTVTQPHVATLAYRGTSAVQCLQSRRVMLAPMGFT